MKIPRRRFLQLAAGAAALPAASRVASAQVYPSRPVRVVVGYAAGDLNDTVARLTGQWLSERLGQPFIIENRPGGGSTLGIETVVRAPSDGYTLLMIGPSAAIIATLYANLKFNFFRDIIPVGGVIQQAQFLVVHPSVPAKTLAELMTYAKVNPGRLSFASPGIASGPHLAGELFRMLSGVDIVHVPYRGAANAITDLLTGQVQLMFTAAAGEHIRQGALRPLAVTTQTSAEQWPDLPPIGDFLPGFESSAWFGIGAPKNTPAEIIKELNKCINVILADEKLKARIADLGGTAIPGSPEAFGKLIADETDKWGKVVKFASLKAN